MKCGFWPLLNCSDFNLQTFLNDLDFVRKLSCLYEETGCSCDYAVILCTVEMYILSFHHLPFKKPLDGNSFPSPLASLFSNGFSNLSSDFNGLGCLLA